MITRSAWLVPWCMLTLLGCSSDKPPRPPAVEAPAVASGAAHAPAASPASHPAAPAATRVVNADGLTLEFLADGRVSFKGNDQWGGRLDTTYETVEYLRKALPVLGRSVTPAQAAALEKAVGGPAAPAGPAKTEQKPGPAAGRGAETRRAPSLAGKNAGRE